MYLNHTGKTTAIRRIAVRETSVSRHYGGPIETPLNHSTVVLMGLRGLWISSYMSDRSRFSILEHVQWQHPVSANTLRKLYFYFLSNLMWYDHGNCFPFDFEPNGITFGINSKGKLSPRSYPIQFERKWRCSFPSIPGTIQGVANATRTSNMLTSSSWFQWQYTRTLSMYHRVCALFYGIGDLPFSILEPCILNMKNILKIIKQHIYSTYSIWCRIYNDRISS